ncbi:hypothetical protein [Sulfurospirillum deleyianum]|uniref:Uncharacterized protein n=1 Tax=Sulfurospirillum deleyianum (strain ATCC 51133 / DSM 6946 / 5175) TaxID=525898 RepID=D1B0B1_SULD5|nr:hypothetical protein [Sulfurospirillum deleyianum]ACZ11728.1 conserved hypothetical protein [Sulfurospirillum deleyianum DSM 6946]
MSIFLSTEIVVFLLIEVILLLLMSIAQGNIILILRRWDFESSTALQYHLEKKNYLVNTILYFTVAVKIILFLFFILSLNSLAGVVPGAMCSAGVVGANVYGNLVLFLKLMLIFGLGLWFLINTLDLTAPNFPHLKPKYWLFSFLFILLCSEFALEIIYFSNIPLKVPVFCCSVVFQSPKLPFGYTQEFLLALYYLLLVSILVLNTLKQKIATLLCNFLFLFVGYYAITYFFGLYIYEMPNHKCPYCMLQKEYYYIGYFIWGFLFLGIFFGMMPYLIERITGAKTDSLLKYSSFFLVLSATICTFYFVHYYLLTGVLL